MKTIYKYPLEVTDYQTLTLKKGAEILCVQTQNEVPCLWAIVDTNASVFEDEFLHLCIYGTGNPITTNPNMYKETYIGTFQLEGGGLVFHVFRCDPA